MLANKAGMRHTVVLSHRRTKYRQLLPIHILSPELPSVAFLPTAFLQFSQHTHNPVQVVLATVQGRDVCELRPESPQEDPQAGRVTRCGYGL